MTAKESYCPKCGARPGWNCVNLTKDKDGIAIGGAKKTPHAERITLAKLNGHEDPYERFNRRSTSGTLAIFGADER